MKAWPDSLLIAARKASETHVVKAGVCSVPPDTVCVLIVEVSHVNLVTIIEGTGVCSMSSEREELFSPQSGLLDLAIFYIQNQIKDKPTLSTN